MDFILIEDFSQSYLHKDQIPTMNDEDHELRCHSLAVWLQTSYFTSHAYFLIYVMEITKEPTSLPFLWELYELKWVRCLGQCPEEEHALCQEFSVLNKSKVQVCLGHIIPTTYLQ